ncbi:MAG: outer membrane protein assembly factor BamD [Bacteroidales bacterium]|nr:outer membrane protein assembly factor BamD [Bacteroidales bacterium]
MIHSKTGLFALALIAMLSSCKSQYDTLLNSNDVDAKYSAAFEYFNQGKYQKSARLFESLSSQTNGTAKDDTVQYYWGLSNYRFKDYYTAETNFETFLDNYPRSAFAREATFLRIDCLYRSTYRYELDQMPTNKAIAAILEYMVEDTEGTHTEVCQHMLDDLNDRLDRKAYENAKLYYKMEDYLASRIALRNVLKEDADNAYREDVLYYIAMSSFKYANLSVAEKQKDRFMTFVDDYYNFISEYEESKYRRELDVLYTRAQRALGKFTGSDEDLKVKEKDFEKERKQLEKAAKEK